MKIETIIHLLKFKSKIKTNLGKLCYYFGVVIHIIISLDASWDIFALASLTASAILRNLAGH